MANPIKEHVRAPDFIPEREEAKLMVRTLRTLASLPDVQTVIEIGSTDGRGSTRALRDGLERNPNFPDVRLFCIEPVKAMYDRLAKERAPYMKCYRVCSVPRSKAYTDKEIERFFREDFPENPFESPAQKQNPRWHSTERDRYYAYFERERIPMDGIALVKDRNRIKDFDLAFVDGGTYTGRADAKGVYGAKYLVLDDIYTLKCCWIYRELMEDQSYERIMHQPITGGHWGYAAFRRCY